MLDQIAKMSAMNSPEQQGAALLAYVVIAAIVACVFLYFGYKIVAGG